VVLDNLLRSQSQPLSNRNIGELGRLENLEENQINVASVLDIVAVGSGDVANASGSEVKGASGLGGLEDGNSAASLEEVTPFVRGGVPVDFADGAGLDDDKGGGEVLGDGEGGRVEDLDGTAGDSVWLLLRPVVGV
jgi:hypothetical protein